MRVLALFALIAIAAQSYQAPAELRVTVAGGFLSYEIVNLSPYRIVGFDIQTQFTSGGFENLGCQVNAVVRSPKDLGLRNICQLPNDSKTGKPVTHSSRIVSVRFDNDLTWTPRNSESNGKP